MKYIVDNLILTAGDYDVIVHGCNCLNVMGKGFAKSLKTMYPGVYKADTIAHKNKMVALGEISTYYDPTIETTFVNAYTQFDYRSGKINVDYTALRKCMHKIKDQYHGKKIGMPLIGCGLGGGDWDIVKVIISEELFDEDVTIVLLGSLC